MEQYLYTYLNHKYGLKQLVIEQSKNLIAAIAHYQESDHDVHLFGLVLRHDIEEEFRTRQQAMLKNFFFERVGPFDSGSVKFLFVCHN